MRRGQVIELKIEEMRFPAVGVGYFEGKKVKVKNAIKGQLIEARIKKNRSDYAEAGLVQVLEPSASEVASFCPHFGRCGGCARQTVPYDEQVAMKTEMVRSIIEESGFEAFEFETPIKSPEIYHYRNKMEYSFGDEEKNGPLQLGMHKKGRFHDVVTVDQCMLVDEDFNTILRATLDYFVEAGTLRYNKNTMEGFLRHFTIRKSQNTGEILLGLSASTQGSVDLTAFVERLLSLTIKGQIVGILWIKNDGIADVVQGEIEVLYGREYYMETLMGLDFKVSFFSFFQTNPEGAELLYQKVIDYTGATEGKEVFDLFSGTGTIGQIMAGSAKRVIGVEIVEDAVRAANENAELNKLENCNFIAGDVFKVLDELDHTPEVIVVDPPRAGIQEKALMKILGYGVPQITYVSCNPKSLGDNLITARKNGYTIERVCCVDMFPHTPHIETVVKLIKVDTETVDAYAEPVVEDKDAETKASERRAEQLKKNRDLLDQDTDSDLAKLLAEIAAKNNA